jgi:stage II sporulation protein D
MNRIVISIYLSILISTLTAQEVSVAIFYDRNLQGITLTIQKGSYLVYNGTDLVDTLQAGNNVNIIKEADYLVYRNRSKAFATDKEIKVKNVGEASFFINNTGSVEPARCYEGWLKIVKSDYHLNAINYVTLESYVAGVVEAEGGYFASDEYYKTQAILCRTYALQNINKHSKEGFELCDGTHCQVYKFKPTNRLIIQAAKKTVNLVIVDKSMSIITPAYHANSGGLTSEAGLVFPTNLDYLKPVKDSFALEGKGYSWKLLITSVEWQSYLAKNGIKSANNMLLKDLMITQPAARKSCFKVGNDSIKLSKISSDWGWKSSYFTTTLEKGVVTVTGKGSGHGVGLSQESAVNMAAKGYTYDRIINFFYKNVHIVNLNTLPIYGVMQKNIEKELPK